MSLVHAGTSLLHFGSSEKSPNLDAGSRVVLVSVPETPPLTLQVKSKGKST